MKNTNIKLKNYIELDNLNLEQAKIKAKKVLSMLDSEYNFTKLYYVVPSLNTVLTVTNLENAKFLGFDEEVIEVTDMNNFPIERLPAKFIEYKELLVKRNTTLSLDDVLNVSQGMVQELKAKIQSSKIPVIKIINYSNLEVPSIVLPSTFEDSGFGSVGMVTSSGDANKGIETLLVLKSINNEILNLLNSKDPFGDGSLVAKYLLEEDAKCLNNSDLDGVLTEVDFSNKTAKFNGSSSKITVDFNLMGSNSLESKSVNFIYSSNEYGIIFHDGEQDNGGYGFQLYTTNKGLFILEGDGSSDGHRNRIKYNQNIADGKKRTFSYTNDNGIQKIFINGDLVHTLISYDSGSTEKFGKMDFGFCYRQYDNTFYVGELSQVEFYNRALNSQEVYMLYKQSKFKDPKIDGLIAHYSMTGNLEDALNNYILLEDGETSYIKDSDGIQLKLEGHNKLKMNEEIPNIKAISYWFRLNKEPNNNSRNLLCRLQSDENSKAYMEFKRYGNDEGYTKFTINDKETNYDFSNTNFTDKLYHLVLNSDGRIFLDNKIIANLDVEEVTYHALTDNFIYSDNDNYKTDVNFKNIRFYNKILTEENVNDIHEYEKGTRSNILDRGLIVKYPLKQSSKNHTELSYDGIDSGDISYDNFAFGNSSDAKIKIPTIQLSNTYSIKLNIYFKGKDLYFLWNGKTNSDQRSLLIKKDKIRIFDESIDYNFEEEKEYKIYLDKDENNKLYINDELIKEFNLSEDILITHLARDNGFNGGISDVVIYNRKLNTQEYTTLNKG